MASAKTYQYRRQIHVAPGQENVDLRDIFERSVLLNVRDGVSVVCGERLFPGVIRPTVDTFFLLDSLELFLLQEARRAEYAKALEVGVGSGMVAKSLPLLLPNLRTLHAVDIDPVAVRCAFSNLTEHLSGPVAADPISTSYRFQIRRPTQRGRIAVSVWTADATDASFTPYDLILCNPPYIPRAPGVARDRERWCSGTEMLEAVVRRDLLGHHGRLVVSVSEGMAGKLVERRARAEGLRILFTRATEVPFKVWEVRNDPDRLRVLLRQGAVRERRGKLFHTLRSYMIGAVGVG